MIVVNLNKSYPVIVAALGSLEHPHPSAYRVQDFNWAGLPEATLGDWYRLSDAKIQVYGDVLLGTYAGLVVSAYEVTSWTQNSAGTVTFTGKPAKDWAPIIGTPQPGGPWKRGEARGTRYVPTNQHRRYHNPNSTLKEWRTRVTQVALTAHDISTGNQTLTRSADDAVEANWAPDGTLEIVIPDNTPHRIITHTAQHDQRTTQALRVLDLPDTPEIRELIRGLQG